MSLSLCGQSVDNTGGLSCDKSRGVIKKLFVFNGSFEDGQYDTAQEFFDNLVANSLLSKSNSNKVFVFPEAQDVADSSEANKEGSLGLGFKTVLIEGKPSYVIKFFAGSDELKRFRTYNNKTIRLVEYDANSTAWVYKTGTSVKGFQAKVFFTGNKVATGQNVEEGVVTCTISILSTSEYFDNCKWVDLSDFNIEDVKALIDVPMAYVSNVTNVHQISMKIPGSDLIAPFNIYDDFMDLIDALTFTAFSGAGDPATSLAITSIVKNATLKTLAVTYDNTAYGTATGNIKLVPPTPATLDAADVTGIELLSVTYPKP